MWCSRVSDAWHVLDRHEKLPFWPNAADKTMKKCLYIFLFEKVGKRWRFKWIDQKERNSITKEYWTYIRQLLVQLSLNMYISLVADICFSLIKLIDCINWWLNIHYIWGLMTMTRFLYTQKLYEGSCKLHYQLWKYNIHI